MIRSIRNTLLLTFFLLIITILLAVSFYFYSYIINNHQNELSEFTENESILLMEIIAPPLWKYDLPEVQGICEKIFENKRINAITLEDEWEEVIFSQSKTETGRIKNDELTILYNSIPIGTLSIEYNLSEIDQLKRGIIRIVIILTLILLLLTAVVIFFITDRLVHKPLSRMGTILKDLKSGNYCWDDTVRNYKETRKVFLLLQELTEELSDSKERIERDTEELTEMNDALLEEMKLRQEAEEELKKSEERYKLATDFADDGIWDWNLITNEIYYSPVWKKMLGYRDAEIPNTFAIWEELTSREDVERSWRMREEVIKHEREKFEIELKMKHKDGRWVNILSRANIVFDSEGIAIRMVGTHVDITKQKKAEEEKARLAEELNQAHKLEALGTLAGGIAHDFNNILASIIGYIELTLDKNNQPELTNHLQEVLRSGMRARDLVKQILAFARKNIQELKLLQPEPILHETLTFLRATLPSSIGIKQTFNSRLSFRGDAVQLHQILLNICTNASDAMKEGGGILTIKLEDCDLDTQKAQSLGLEAGSFVRLTVQDEGTGISPEVRDSIFQPYFTTKEFGKGTGMGLAIVHGIVESFGGKIFCDSILGEGTTFSLYFPGQESISEKQEVKGAADVLGSERILFIDDEESIGTLVEITLSSLGYNLTCLTDPREALEKFRESPDSFDLVISDMTMPYLTGDILAVELLKIRKDIPIILCTGYSSQLIDEGNKDICVRKYLTKPLRKKELAVAIREVLDEREPSRHQSKAP